MDLYMMTEIDGIKGYTPIEIVNGKMKQLDGMYHVANAIANRGLDEEGHSADEVWDAIYGLCEQAIKNPTVEVWGDYAAQLVKEVSYCEFMPLTTEDVKRLEI